MLHALAYPAMDDEPPKVLNAFCTKNVKFKPWFYGRVRRTTLSKRARDLDLRMLGKTDKFNILLERVHTSDGSSTVPGWTIST